MQTPPYQPYLHAQPPVIQDRFAFDKYLLNQKVMSLGGKYFVFNEAGQQLFYIDRPAFKLHAHIGIYEDETKARKLLDLRQDSAWALINLSFTLLDEQGQVLAQFKRQGWKSILRRTWRILDPMGNEIAMAEEDSMIKAIMRRVPYLDIIGDMMRTNFIITRNGSVIGEFIRKFTLADKYVMDLTQDRMRSLDRRIAVALSVLLDNAESR
jgi:uncharacterized protein YxjI